MLLTGQLLAGYLIGALTVAHMSGRLHLAGRTSAIDCTHGTSFMQLQGCKSSSSPDIVSITVSSTMSWWQKVCHQGRSSFSEHCRNSVPKYRSMDNNKSRHRTLSPLPHLHVVQTTLEWLAGAEYGGHSQPACSSAQHGAELHCRGNGRRLHLPLAPHEGALLHAGLSLWPPACIPQAAAAAVRCTALTEVARRHNSGAR